MSVHPIGPPEGTLRAGNAASAGPITRLPAAHRLDAGQGFRGAAVRDPRRAFPTAPVPPIRRKLARAEVDSAMTGIAASVPATSRVARAARTQALITSYLIDALAPGSWPRW